MKVRTLPGYLKYFLKFFCSCIGGRLELLRFGWNGKINKIITLEVCMDGIKICISLCENYWESGLVMLLRYILLAGQGLGKGLWKKIWGLYRKSWNIVEVLWSLQSKK